MTNPPPELHEVASRFITTEYVTIDAGGNPIVWPVTPYLHPHGGGIDICTGLGYPKKAKDAEANPSVALLFSDPTGSGMEDAPMVLVQGTARVDDEDLQANADRYARESAAKLPAAMEQMPPKFLQRFMVWYTARLYVHVEPEVVWVWPHGDAAAEPQIVEVRPRAPAAAPPAPAAATERSSVWDERLAELGAHYTSGVLAIVDAGGAPFAVRLGLRADAGAKLIHLEDVPDQLPIAPGRACVTAHDHAPDFTWQRNFQVRGELRREGDGWALVPQKVIGGFELPPGSALARMRLNAKKVKRFRSIARRELARRT